MFNPLASLCNPPDEGNSDGFWLPSESLSESVSDESIRSVTFPDSLPPELPWYEKNPTLLRETMLSLVIIAVGSNLIALNIDDSEDGRARGFFGSVFYESSIVGVTYAIFGNLRTNFERKFLLEDIPTVVFLIIALLLARNPPDISWPLFLGTSLFEAALVDIIVRSMYFLPAKEDENVQLRRENKLLRESVARGLADSYFTNFLLWVVKDLKALTTTTTQTTKNCTSSGKSNTTNSSATKDPKLNLNVPMGFKNPQFRKYDPSCNESEYLEAVDCQLCAPALFVLLPLKIDWKQNASSSGTHVYSVENRPWNPINDYLWDGRRSGAWFDCNFGGQSKDFRPQWLLINADPLNLKNSRAGYLLDIPTTIAGILRNAEELYKDDTEAKQAYYLDEIHRFSMRLAWTVRKYDVEHLVRIVLVNRNWNEDWQTLKNKSTSTRFKDLMECLAQDCQQAWKDGPKSPRHSKPSQSV